MKDDDVLRLLVIEYSMEDAEHLLSTLRNAGIAVRPSTAENAEELDKVLNGKTPDLVLINTAHQELTVSVVAETVNRTGKDVPVIALLDEFNVDHVIEALGHGATDAVSSEHSEHFIAVIKRERLNLAGRRRFRFIEKNLRESEARCEALLGSSRDAISYVHEGMHQHANPAYMDLFGYEDFEELESVPILDMVAGEAAGRLKEILRSLSKGEEPPESIEIQIRLPDGSSKDAVMEFSPASYQGEPCTQIVFRDKSIPDDIAQLKDKDLVTGLYNRQYMLNELEQAIEKNGDDGKFTLLFIDMDNFRETLNQVGMAGVDMVLADIASVIQDQLGEKDIAGRFGDQTFAVGSPDIDLKAAKKLAQKLCKSVEAHISEVGDNSITMTCSIGVTPIFEGITNAQDLLSVAGAAAHTASAAGGNRIHVHDPSAAEGEANENLSRIEMVKDALSNDRLVLVYQPIVSLHGEEGKKYEVLMRLENQDGEELKPSEFMPAIQDHELMVKIDTWVIQRAVEVLKEANEEHLLFFIKLSPQTVSESKVLPWLAKLLQKHRVSGQHLVFEMPESKVMTNLKPAKTFLKGLKQLHCQFALEQFGSGLNSFQILKHLPADFLKIDRTFMKDLPKQKENQDKIKELSDQAHSQGKITIAEFVEDAASMSILWQCGVNFVQGNFLQEPEKVMSYDFG